VNTQIVHVLRDVEVIDYIFDNNINTKNMESFPFVTYQNGMPCNVVNIYLQSHENEDLSDSTLKKKAFDLSHLIKYCFNKKMEIVDFTEKDLFSLALNLKENLNEKTIKNRRNTTINEILKNILYLYEHIGKNYFNDDEYCEKKFNAKKNKTNIKLNDSNNSIEKTGWHHKCFFPYSFKRKRTPISKNEIEMFYNAIPELSKSTFVIKRTIVMLKLLEITGARSGELAYLKIEDIEKAYSESKPMLKMVTLKNKIKAIRFVPLEKIELKDIISFIKIHRSRIIRKTVGKLKDEGYLFISETTGKKILNVTLTNEIKRLKDLTGISTQACAHMFRHRFITKYFVRLIKQYDFENKDDFRNALLDVNTLKTQIQQVTGHQNVASLEHYIDLAKEELTNLKEVISKVDFANKNESYERAEEDLLRKLENKEININQYSKELKELKNKKLSI
jgi:integrase